MKIKKIVFSGLFAALACIATMLIQISIPGGGYFNLGDCIVLVSGVVLGPVFGFFSAAIGTSLADLFSGFVVYAPATFVIKGLMALIISLFFSKTENLFLVFIGACISEIVMVLGYFLFECILTLNIGTAVLGVPGNLMQGLVGVTSSIALIALITKNKAVKKILFE